MRVLHPLPERKKRDYSKDFYVIDIETKNGLSPKPDNFVFGVIYGRDVTMVMRSVDEFYKELSKRKYRNKKIFAHNGEFDFSGIFGNIILNVDNSSIFNGKFISAKYNDVTLCDSFNVLPTSVKKLGELIGLEKLDTPDEFLQGDDIKITPLMIDYCIRDCEIVFNSLLNVFEMVGGIRITIASLSMYYFRKDFLDKPIIYNELNDQFFDSYYGGRTEAFKIGKCKGKVFDINSLYPYIMTITPFPDTKNLKKYDRISVGHFHYLLKRKEGIFKGKIFHRKTHLGYIPYKDEKSGKLLFPTGYFNVAVNFNELRFAIEQGVVEIISVDYVICASKMKSPFINYVNQIYSLRLKTENEFLKYFYKLVMNSLYGRFGMRKKYQSTYYDQIPYELISELKQNFEYYELKLFSHKRNDCYLVTENKKNEKMFFSIPSIASYITSAARVELLRGLLSNQKSVLYCDTDSIFIEGEPQEIKIGDKLGEWKKEEKTVIEVRGLKNYSIRDNDGMEKKIIKGVNKRSVEISPYVFEVEKYYKTKESIRRQKETGEKYIAKKKVTNKYDKREVLKDGKTKPFNFDN
jgi:hypothetical protein